MHGVRRCRSKPFPPFRGSAYQSPMKSTGTFSSLEQPSHLGEIVRGRGREHGRRTQRHRTRVSPSEFRELRFCGEPPCPRRAFVSLSSPRSSRHRRPRRTTRARAHSSTIHHRAPRRRATPALSGPRPARRAARDISRASRARASRRRPRASQRPRALPPARRRRFPAYSLPHRRRLAPRARGRARRRDRLDRPRGTSALASRGAGAVPFDRAARRPVAAFARPRPRVRAHKYRRIDRRRVASRFRIARTSQFDPDRRRPVSRIVFNRCRGGARSPSRARSRRARGPTRRRVVDSRARRDRPRARADADVASRASRARVDAGARRDQPRGRGRRRRAYAGARLSRSGDDDRAIRARASAIRGFTAPGTRPAKKIRPARFRYFSPRRID